MTISARTTPFGLDDFQLVEDDSLPPIGPAVIAKWKASSCYYADPDNFAELPEEQQAAIVDHQAKLLDYYLKQMMCRSSNVKLLQAGKYAGKVVHWIPGHILGDRLSYGPDHADIMVIGKFPGEEEDRVRRCWTGPPGKLLAKELSLRGVDLAKCYGTYVTKFTAPYASMKTIPAAWVKECAWFLQQEIRIVKPKFILLLGADALKAVMGKQATVHRYRGLVAEFAGAKVMVTNNPSDLLRNPENIGVFQQDLDRFCTLVKGGDLRPKDVEYHYIRTVEQLKDVVDACMDSTTFSLDCEWSGETYFTGHLLTIQFSRKAREAFVVVLRSDVNNTEFSPSPSAAIAELKRLLQRPEVAVVGHNLRGDLKWLMDVGLDLRSQFAVNGFDTMLAHHLLMENAEHNLSACALTDTDMGRYDAELESYRANGYIHWTVPEDVLLPYAAGDADATFRLYEKYRDTLWAEHCEMCKVVNRDPYEACYGPEDPRLKTQGWVPSRWNLLRYVVVPVNMAILEMEMTGVLGDQERIRAMSELFASKRDQFVNELRAVIHEPDFNPRSPLQVKRLLFGKPGLECKDGVVHTQLGLTPIKTTGKRSKRWSECVVDKEVYYLETPRYSTVDGEEVMTHEAGWNSDFHAPSTDAESLAVLAEENDCPEAVLLRNFRFIDQICKNFLSSPEMVNGEEVYTSGLGEAIRRDGRIHTTFSQLTETGRYRSSDPNCFSADTNVLTNEGWVPFPVVCKERRFKLAQYDRESSLITFAEPLGYITHMADELVHIHTEKHIDLLVTPDHDCLLRRRKTGAFCQVLAADYPEDCQQIQAGAYDGGKLSLTEAEVALIAAMQADSYILPTGQISWDFTKDRKIERLRWALEREQITFTEHRRGKKVTFYLPKQEVTDWLTSWKNFDKRILNFSYDTLLLFADEVFFWDGCWKRKSMYSSNNKVNAEWVQIAQVLTGRRARIRKYQGKKSENWQVDVTQVDNSGTSNVKKDKVPGRVKVYCVTMPKGTVIVQRGGNVAVTKQCQNLPKGREGDLAKLFRADEAMPPIRTCLLAAPGHVLMEADFESAELYTLAWIAKDARMKEDLERRDSKGKKISLHTTQAVNIFKLNMTPEEFDMRRKKDGPEAKKLDGLRVSAKSVNFGIPSVSNN